MCSNFIIDERHEIKDNHGNLKFFNPESKIVIAAAIGFLNPRMSFGVKELIQKYTEHVCHVCHQANPEFNIFLSWIHVSFFVEINKHFFCYSFIS